MTTPSISTAVDQHTVEKEVISEKSSTIAGVSDASNTKDSNEKNGAVITINKCIADQSDNSAAILTSNMIKIEDAGGSEGCADTDTICDKTIMKSNNIDCTAGSDDNSQLKVEIDSK